MPKQVDHQARRRLIAEALWRVALRHGLEGVSLRHVATEAGVSMGLVQHYFATKDQMLLFALGTLDQRVTQRVAERIATLPDPTDARALTRAVLLEMLPVDEDRHSDAVIGFAFFAQAATRPAIATALRLSVAQLQAFVGEQICHAQAVGQAAAILDPAREATALLALADGLAMQVLVAARSPEMVLMVLDDHLDRLFSSPSKNGAERG
jgi:AcrR family transcriptional regulator